MGDDNFLPWRMQALATIKGHRLYKYLLGEKHVPPRMVGCTYSYQIWNRLEEVYSNATLARERQLKNDLRNTKKGSSSMSKFVLKIKKVADALVAIGLPVSKHDHIEAILDGLGEDYEGFITSFSMRKDDYSVSEIEALLLAQEARVEKVKKHVENVSANVAQRGFSQNGRGQQNSFGNFIGGFQNGRGSFNQRGGFQNGGVNCYNRFNQSYTEATLAQFIGKNQGQTLQNKQSGSSSSPMEALLATSETVKQPYDGGEQVHIANGSGLAITHIGNSELISNSKALRLNQILHVPDVSKNLLSISKFAKDNGVYFEFHSNKCFVKSQGDNRVLLEGKIKKGLYLFDSLSFGHKVQSPISANTASAFVSSTNNSSIASSLSSSSSLGIWHCRLGHLALPIVKSVLTSCNLSVIFDETSFPFKNSKLSSSVSPESVSSFSMPSPLSLPLVLTPIDSTITTTQNLPNIDVQTNGLDGELRVSSTGTSAVVVPSFEPFAVVHNSQTSPSVPVAEVSTELVTEVSAVVNSHSMVTRSKAFRLSHCQMVVYYLLRLSISKISCSKQKWQHVTITRPDLSFLVNKVYQFMHEPKLVHWQAVKKILRYLQGTLDYGLSYTSY
ncbi:Retrovirus-related Pol polyprotein from transposon TNT 1-94 [Senna tora]|uniref:Retrovirus-related Pol polyprotein from transposon TNT 1-94 n=1 Tax=Senna tora TaxID=362788 RepID=A0A834T1F1_9FABA|nr:Retrovirus-related Pol polyprotein from transposon TNT 1-94 [Senna tora]